ncbi:hypothetical protein [Streptomyces flaveolus]|uniref:HoxN/HupN/NixA family nickel/cobalt transporter n=1 Tax=Streptomyces flaveolus TaxID=67297 RepID=UPI003F5416F4
MAAVLRLHLTGRAADIAGGTGVRAYVLGMRHAFDADHIAAIGNTTRKLMRSMTDVRTVASSMSTAAEPRTRATTGSAGLEPVRAGRPRGSTLVLPVGCARAAASCAEPLRPAFSQVGRALGKWSLGESNP